MTAVKAFLVAVLLVTGVAASPFDLIGPVGPRPVASQPLVRQDKKLTFQEVVNQYVNTQKPGQKICIVTCKRCTPEQVERERQYAKQMVDTVVVEIVDDENRVPDGVSDHHFSTEPSKGKLSIPPAGTKSPRTEESRGLPPGVVEDVPTKPTQFTAPPPPPGEGWQWDAANGVYRKITYVVPKATYSYAYVYTPQPVTYAYTPSPVTYYAAAVPYYVQPQARQAPPTRAGIGFFGSRGGFAGIGYSTQGCNSGSC